MGSENYEGNQAYKMLEWEHNCVIQALSKVLGKGQIELVREIVDGKLGGITMINQIENNSVIKKLLVALNFRSLIEGGAKWKNIRQLLGGEAKKGRFYAIWWHGGQQKEDWTDAPTQTSDHAFAIFCNDTDIEVPVTNLPDFDLGHPTDEEWVSVFIPKMKDKIIPCTRRDVLSSYHAPKQVKYVKGRDDRRKDRRFSYNG
jgi:hypothetical protein